VNKRVRGIALWVATVLGAGLGAFFGFAMSMWGGIEVFLPMMAVLFALVAYVGCRMVFSAVDAFRG
jgi:hypothetical protein